MTDFTSVSIPPPKDWQAFERHARLLFEHSLGDPGTQNNGRTGQPQHGVDIFGKRGGANGPQVGVQCKGKDSGYGGTLTEAELRREVEKTKNFKPEIREFILVTTAPDDGAIQQAARLLELEVRAAGRDLSIAVWGWGRVQQEIAKCPDALRAFHPDASPFTGEILDETKEVRRLVERQGDTQQVMLDVLGEVRQALGSLTPKSQIAADTQPSGSTLDKHFNDQIDTYRDLIRADKPKTAFGLLAKMKDQVWPEASPRIKFRILANMGAAQHRLGEFDQAADLLLEAAPFDPDEPTSIANKIAALLIKDQRGEAHSLAVNAMVQHPDNADIALQRVQALAPGETVEMVWPLLAGGARKHADVVIFRALALRDAGSTQWRDVIRDAIADHPADQRLKAIDAEGVLERILRHDASAVGLTGDSVPTDAELRAAAATLEQAWQASLGHETPAYTALAHNAALLRNILREPGKAAALLDEAISAGSDFEETKRLRISIYRGQGKLKDAIDLADTLPDTNLNNIIRADLRTERDPAKVRELLANRAAFTDRREVIAAALAVLESDLAQGKFDDATHEVDRLGAALPGDPHAPLAMYRVKAAHGDADADRFLTDAVRLVSPTTEFPTRFLVCEALKDANRYDDIVDLLTGVVATSYDSPALRTLVAASVNADRRPGLKQLLDQIASELLDKPFYRRAKIGHAIRTGNIKKAEQEIRAYLALRPRDLGMQLQLMHALFRQNKMTELQAEAARAASDFDGAPEDFMKLAQFKDNFGDWRQAHDLAYRTLLANQTKPAVNMGYVGVFFGPGHSKELDVSPKAVAEEMAVRIDRDDGHQTTYIIEPQEALRPTPDYLAPTHKIADLLMGKTVGDEIVLPDGTKAKVVSIKPKVLHALQNIMDNFQNLFPEVEGLERVRIQPGTPGGLEPMLERVRERHDAIEGVTRLYDAGTLPLALVGRALGTDPVDTFLGLIETGHAIKVCEGRIRSVRSR